MSGAPECWSCWISDSATHTQQLFWQRCVVVCCCESHTYVAVYESYNLFLLRAVLRAQAQVRKTPRRDIYRVHTIDSLDLWGTNHPLLTGSELILNVWGQTSQQKRH